MVGTYDPEQRLFWCRRYLPLEGIPAITEISVASFGELLSISAVSCDEHRLHLEVFSTFGLQRILYERASSKEDGRSLFCWGPTFLSPDAAAPLFHLEVSINAFSKELVPLLAS